MRVRRGFAFFILTILVGVVVFLYFVLQRRLAFYQDPWPAPVVGRTATDLPTNFDPVTHLTGVFIEADPQNSTFFLVEDFLHIVGALDPNGAPELNRMELPTTEVVWNANVPIGAAVVHNSTHIYVGTVGIARVTARELETGTVDWSTTLLPRKSVGSMTADDTTVWVETVPLSFYVLDAQTGEIIDEREDFLGLPVYFGEGNIMLIRLARGILTQSLESGSTLWRIDLDDDVTSVQVSGDSRLLLRTGRDVGSVYAIDIESGDILWRTDKNVVSNIAVVGVVAFFLTEDAELQAVNVETGRPMSVIQFEPPEVVLQTDGHKRPFLVAASSSLVAVYFGDAREILSYRFAFPEQ